MSDDGKPTQAATRPQAKTGNSKRRRHRSNAPRQGDQRRELILDSFEEILRTTPIAEVSMDAIAKASSLHRTSVYFYFVSKADALDALIARATDEMRTAMYGRTSDESMAEFTTRIVAAALTGWRRHRQTFAAAVELSSHLGVGADKWREVMRDFAGTLGDAILQGKSDTNTAEAYQRGEIVCWMVERNLYFLFTGDHDAAAENSLAQGLARAAYAVLADEGSDVGGA